MNKENRKTYFPIVLLFIILNALILAFKTFLENHGFDTGFLIWANLFLFLISSGGFLLQRKGLQSPNPQAFVRGVYASMIFKMFIVIVVVLIYVFLVRDKINKPGLFTAMGLYIVYTVVEVTALTKAARKKKMPKKESPLAALSPFLPERSFDEVANYLQQYKVHLTITRERQTILGNYRNKVFDKNHRISINGNLNKYSFLITLLHELAHLLAHEKYGYKIQAHGKQWKEEYGKILSEFIPKKIFPQEIEKLLLQRLKNPAATTCAEPHLTRALKMYDVKKEGYFFVEELQEGCFFKVRSGAIFKKGERIRKRFKCLEVSTKKTYLFSPVYEVALVS